MSDFIQFVSINANNKDMGNNFLNIMSDPNTDKSKLQTWFKGLGYDITMQECQELIDNKKNIIDHLSQVKGY